MTTTFKLTAIEVEALRQALMSQFTDSMTVEQIAVTDKLYTRMERALDRMGA